MCKNYDFRVVGWVRGRVGWVIFEQNGTFLVVFKHCVNKDDNTFFGFPLSFIFHP